MGQAPDLSNGIIENRGVDQLANVSVARAHRLLGLSVVDASEEEIRDPSGTFGEFTVKHSMTGRRSGIILFSDHIFSSGPPGTVLPQTSRSRSRSARAGFAHLLGAGGVPGSKGVDRTRRGEDDAVRSY